MGVALVAGTTTDGVGKRVVQRLIERGYKVHTVVEDTDTARAILGNNVELVIIKSEDLTPQMMANVQVVVYCTEVRVQPFKGDTLEMLEYLEIKNLVEATANYLNTAPEKLLFDFTNPSSELKDIWGAVDDVVMGGVSQSDIQLVEGTALFAGNVSTQNSGGFASVRTRNFEPPFNLAGYDGVELRVRGDGKRYKFLVRTESKWDGTAYSYSFDAVSNGWIDVRIPFGELTPVFRAKTLKDSPPIDTSKICSFQLMLSKFEYDGELNPKFSPGGFALQVEFIKAYGGATLPRFVLVSSVGMTRTGSLGINLEEPPARKLNDQQDAILTWKLRGEDTVRESGVPYTIIRPCALTEEPGVQALIFEQGDSIKGKVSQDSVAEVCVQALEQPKASNVTFDVKAVQSSSDSSNNWQSLFECLRPDK